MAHPTLPTLSGLFPKFTQPLYEPIMRANLAKMCESCLRASPFRLNTDEIMKGRVDEVDSAASSFRAEYGIASTSSIASTSIR